MDLVFAAPTIAALARVVAATVHSSTDDSALRDAHTPADLWKYVEKYSANLPVRPANLVERRNGKDVVLITGTTGGFGCDTLEHLLKDENVEKVYAFNRKDSLAIDRQREQFKARGLDETLLDLSKFRMVEAVLDESGFGVEQEVLDEVSVSVWFVVCEGRGVLTHEHDRFATLLHISCTTVNSQR